MRILFCISANNPGELEQPLMRLIGVRLIWPPCIQARCLGNTHVILGQEPTCCQFRLRLDVAAEPGLEPVACQSTGNTSPLQSEVDRFPPAILAAFSEVVVRPVIWNGDNLLRRDS